MNLTIRHIICLVWLVAVFTSFVQAGNMPEDGGMPDTALIRVWKQKLAKEVYPNPRKECYAQLEQLAIKTGDKQLLADCCFELAYIMLQQSEHRSTMQYTQRALQYYEAENDSTGRNRCYCIMGNLYSLFSPEQSDLYYQRCYSLAHRKDSADAVISRSVMNLLPLSKSIEAEVVRDINNINLKVLDAPQRSTVDYLFAAAAHRSGNIDEAFRYALRADTFYTAIPQFAFMAALNKRELASLYVDIGDLEKAKHALALGEAICKRDNYRMISIANMQLLSEIHKLENHEMESLLAFKQYIDMRDSLLGLHQVQSFNELLMRNLLDEDVRKHLSDNNRRQKPIYIILIIVLLFGMAMLYHFRDIFRRGKEKYLLLSELSEQNRQLGSNPKLKQHLTKMMFDYKKGLDYYLGQTGKKKNAAKDPQTLSRYIDEANVFIDWLKKWMDEHPYSEETFSFFEVGATVNVNLHMLEIIFAPKRITVHNNIGPNVVVFGNRIYFSIAFELLLNEAFSNASEESHITLSIRDDLDFVIFTVQAPTHMYSDEECAAYLQLTRKMRANIDSKPLESIHEIFLKCIYDNNGNAWLESNLAQKTLYSLSMPKKDFNVKQKGQGISI